MKKIILATLVATFGAYGLSNANTTSTIKEVKVVKKCKYSPNIDGVQWYHNSDERKAIYLEIYNVAANKIKEEVKKDNLKKGTWGVVLDADETLINNSWDEYQNYCNYKFNNQEFLKERAVAQPGAVMFTHLVHKLGGYVSVVTNRSGSDKGIFKATIANLKAQNIYFDQALLSNSNSNYPHNKNPRFKAVESGNYRDINDMVITNKLPAHKIIAFFGDNIQDFPTLTQKNMKNIDNSNYKLFGSKYFIFPNPMYGSSWK